MALESNVASLGLDSMPGWLMPAGSSFDESTANHGGTFSRALWSWNRDAERRTEDWPRTFIRALPICKRVAQWRPGVSATVTPFVLTKTESDDRTYGFDFSGAPEVWDGDEVVDSVASGTVSGGSGLTFGSVTALSADFDDIPAEAGLKCDISGGDAGSAYPFAMVATLTSGRVLTIPCRMVVVADYPSS